MLECVECPYCDYGLGGQYCEKVGGKTLLYGYCEDAYSQHQSIISGNHSKQKRRNKRERDLMYKNHIKYLAKTYPSYPPPAMPVDENGRWNFDDPVGTVYYRRTYRGNHKGNRYSFYKKYSNRCVRGYKGKIHSKGNQYRKIFDYWWTVD